MSQQNNRRLDRLDSHQMFANDVFDGQDELFKHVFPVDRDEVRCQFARMVAEAAAPANLLVCPLHMTDKFRAAQSASGGGFSASQIKTKSNRIYWVGFSTKNASANHKLAA